MNIAIILVRGLLGTKQDTRRTLEQLNLVRKNTLVILPDDKRTRGMLNVIRNVATFGTIDDALIKEISAKKKNFGKEKQLVFHLNPPRGGFGRKGIKKSFSVGGALGDRKEDISILIKKML